MISAGSQGGSRKKFADEEAIETHCVRTVFGIAEFSSEEQAIVPQVLKPRLEAWMRLRNEVVHSAASISKAQATEVVNGVMGWILEQ